MTVTLTCPDCGYTHTYTEAPAAAAAHHARHSCDRERHRQHVQARRTRTARVTRDCAHPHAQHVHGTRAAYVKDRCRCQPCTTANATYHETRARLQARGTWNPLVDVAEVRKHLAGLRTAGLGIYQIARAARVDPVQVRDIAYGRAGQPQRRRVRQETARKLLAITPDVRRPGTIIDARITRRQLQALAAIGWSPRALAPPLQRRAANILRWQSATTITTGNADHITAVYAKLRLQLPPQHTAAQQERADTTQTQALAAGWLPPLAWDDIATDPDPNPGPGPRPRAARTREQQSDVDDIDIDEIAVERAADGDSTVRLNRAETDAAIELLIRRRVPHREIAGRLNICHSTVTRRLAKTHRQRDLSHAA